MGNIKGRKSHLPVALARLLCGQGVRCQGDREQHGQQAEVQNEDEDEEDIAGV